MKNEFDYSNFGAGDDIYHSDTDIFSRHGNDRLYQDNSGIIKLQCDRRLMEQAMTFALNEQFIEEREDTLKSFWENRSEEYVKILQNMKEKL